MSTIAMWRVAATVALFSYGLPVIFVVLARSGWSWSAVLPLLSSSRNAQSWLTVLETVILFAVPLLTVLIPGILQTRGRAAAASSLVSGWLAGFASVATAAFILTLHFGGIAESDLRKAHMGILSVAAFAVAVLLVPFYRVVAKACLQRGIAVAFDPVRWWSAWCTAYREMRTPAGAAGALPDGTEAAGGGRGTGGTGDDSEVSAGAT